jgi:6-phosphogluconolactonase (cycloisomerase 2 family)
VSTLSGIYLYAISSNGELILSDSTQLLSADQAASMEVDATNSWLIEGFKGSANLYAIHVNPSNGMLASMVEETVALASSHIQQVAISPDNKYVFVAMGPDGTAIIPFNSRNSNPFGRPVTIPTKNSRAAQSPSQSIRSPQIRPRHVCCI